MTIPHDINDEDILLYAAKALDNFFNAGRQKGAPRKVGFVLMVWPFDDEYSKCISNCADKQTLIDLMRRTIEEFEGPGGHA